MKAFRGILTALLFPLLMAATALSLLSGLLRFALTEPQFFKRNLESQDYITQMQGYIKEELEHIEILYDLPQGATDGVVTDDDIINYTHAYIDELFKANEDGTMAAVQFPKKGFLNLMLGHGAQSYEAAEDFANDCASAVEGCLAPIQQPVVLSAIGYMLNHKLVLQLTALFVLLLGLTLGLMVLLMVTYVGRLKSGLIATFGATFCGGSLIFAPALVFLIKDYIQRLNLAQGAYRLQLSAILGSLQNAALTVAGIVVALSLIIILIACITKKRR